MGSFNRQMGKLLSLSLATCVLISMFSNSVFAGEVGDVVYQKNFSVHATRSRSYGWWGSWNYEPCEFEAFEVSDTGNYSFTLTGGDGLRKRIRLYDSDDEMILNELTTDASSDYSVHLIQGQYYRFWVNFFDYGSTNQGQYAPSTAGSYGTLTGTFVSRDAVFDGEETVEVQIPEEGNATTKYYSYTPEYNGLYTLSIEDAETITPIVTFNGIAVSGNQSFEVTAGTEYSIAATGDQNGTYRLVGALDPYPAGIATVTPNPLSITVGESATTFTVTLDPAGTSYTAADLTWTSSNEHVIVANNDGVLSVSADASVEGGEATITASFNDAQLNGCVTVIVSEQSITPANVDMYRLYNPNSGEHFYTSNAAERDMLIGVGWSYEGIGWTAPAISNTPVYRLYNANGGEHHYTTNVAERDFLISIGWTDEDIGWYSDDARTVPLYRQYNPNAFANNHNYTTSLDENNWLVSIGWQSENIGWYGVG